MRHGAEPWDALAVKLMLKWPNLYYSTSAFAPRYYPQTIIDYANTRGADKVMYAGYFPMGLSLERIFAELPNVPLQGRRVAQVPARERRPGVRAGRLTMATAPLARSPFPVPVRLVLHRLPGGLPDRSSRRRIFYFDRHLVAWRDDAGELHVQDPFCPHLGAHLGHGGTVEDCQIVCPFHGWKFDAEGVNTEIPYSERTNRKGTPAHLPGRRAQRRLARLVPPGPRSSPDVGDPRAARVQRRPGVVHGHPHRAHGRRAVAGDGRERRRLGPLPVRAQHRRGAGDGELRDRLPGHADAIQPEVPDARAA